MSHTNSTTNYSLPQFVGTDKPAWLTDINGAFSAIDTNLKTASDNATTAGTAATTANTSIGTLASLSTTEKTNLVGAINEVNTAAGTASGVASGAVATANQASTKVNGLEAYLDLVTFTTPTVNATNGTITRGDVACASNTNGTMGKVYGEIRVTSNVNGNVTVSFATPLRPTEAIDINGGMINFWSDNGSNFAPGGMIAMHLAVDGTASFTISASANRQYRLYLMNSVIFAQNFGDVPTPE